MSFLDEAMSVNESNNDSTFKVMSMMSGKLSLPKNLEESVIEALLISEPKPSLTQTHSLQDVLANCLGITKPKLTPQSK